MDRHTKLIDHSDLLYKLNYYTSIIRLPYYNCFVNKYNGCISLIEIKYLIIFNYFQ